MQRIHILFLNSLYEKSIFFRSLYFSKPNLDSKLLSIEKEEKRKEKAVADEEKLTFLSNQTLFIVVAASHLPYPLPCPKNDA